MSNLYVTYKLYSLGLKTNTMWIV